VVLSRAEGRRAAICIDARHAKAALNMARNKIGFKRAAVAVARRLAVTMHAMLKSGAVFDRAAGLPA